MPNDMMAIAATDPSTIMASAIADLQRSNPQLAMLAQAMQARAAAAAPPVDTSADLANEAAELSQRLVETEARISEMNARRGGCSRRTASPSNA